MCQRGAGDQPALAEPLTPKGESEEAPLAHCAVPTEDASLLW